MSEKPLPTFEEAFARVLERVTPLPAETLETAAAAGRWLAALPEIEKRLASGR